MLKVNEKFLREALSEMKQCNKELYNHIEQANNTWSLLSKNSSLDEETVKLKQILDRMDMINFNIKSMTRVLDYAAFEYGRCENNVVLQCEQSMFQNRNESRFDKVVFNVPFSKKIDWKKGVQNGNKF